MVSVKDENAEYRILVRIEETSESEPFDEIPKEYGRRQNRTWWSVRDKPRRNLLTDWVAAGTKAA